MRLNETVMVDVMARLSMAGSNDVVGCAARYLGISERVINTWMRQWCKVVRVKDITPENGLISRISYEMMCHTAETGSVISFTSRGDPCYFADESCRQQEIDRVMEALKWPG